MGTNKIGPILLSIYSLYLLSVSAQFEFPHILQYPEVNTTTWNSTQLSEPCRVQLATLSIEARLNSSYFYPNKFAFFLLIFFLSDFFFWKIFRDTGKYWNCQRKPEQGLRY